MSKLRLNRLINLTTFTKKYNFNPHLIQKSYTFGIKTIGSTSISSINYLTPVYQPLRQFHVSKPVKMPVPLPAILIKGVLYAARASVSLFPFIKKNKYYKSHPHVFQLGLFTTLTLTVLILISSVDRNPFTSRYRLLLNALETESFYQMMELEGILAEASLDDYSQRAWEDTTNQVLAKLYKVITDSEVKTDVVFVNQPDVAIQLLLCDKLVVTRGFLNFINGDVNLLAAAISHLLAHNLCQHSSEVSGISALLDLVLDVVRSGIYTFTFYFPFLNDAIALSLGFFKTETLERPFKLKMEKEADIIAMHILARAKYDPQYLLTLFDKLESNATDLKQQSDKSNLDTFVDGFQDSMKKKVPAFKELHCSYDDRLLLLKDALPPAIQIFNDLKNGKSLQVKEIGYLYQCEYFRQSLKVIQ